MHFHPFGIPVDEMVIAGIMMLPAGHYILCKCRECMKKLRSR